MSSRRSTDSYQEVDEWGYPVVPDAYSYPRQSHASRSSAGRFVRSNAPSPGPVHDRGSRNYPSPRSSAGHRSLTHSQSRAPARDERGSARHESRYSSRHESRHGSSHGLSRFHADLQRAREDSHSHAEAYRQNQLHANPGMMPRNTMDLRRFNAPVVSGMPSEHTSYRRQAFVDNRPLIRNPWAPAESAYPANDHRYYRVATFPQEERYDPRSVGEPVRSSNISPRSTLGNTQFQADLARARERSNRR